MNKKITIMPSSDSRQYHEKMSYLEGLINDLYQDEKYLLPVFLLRCQLIELSLKYLLANYPYRSKEFVSLEKIEELTLGQTVSELKKIKDVYMDEIVEKADKLKEMRNDLTHNFIKSDITINEMNIGIEENMKFADQIEGDIYRYFSYVNEVLFGKENRFIG